MEIFRLDKAIEKLKTRSGNGHSSTQGSKGASFPIPKKKKGTCKSDEANNAIKELLENNGSL